MNDQKVSIIIPTFNRAKYVVTCIESCLVQTVDCEIIVCDHGSTDNTPEVMKTYTNKVKYIRREIDSGVHFCWLDAILHASNDLIHINFDDDWIEPTFIEECLNLFTEEVGCVFTDAKIFFENENRYDNGIFNFHPETGIYSSKQLSKYNMRELTSPCAGIFRKQILIDNLFVGNVPFSENHYHGVGPDILFSLMTTLNYPKYGFVKKDLAVFRAHDNSITINALSDDTKTKNIKKAYDDARIFYLINKFVKKYNIIKLVKKFKIK